MTATARLRSVPAAAKRDDRPAFPIDDLLRWTVRDELPKRQDERDVGPRGSGLHPMWRHGIFGARIDCWSREPGMPLAAGDPHPDALVIEAALAELDGLIKAADQGRGPIPFDLAPYQIGAGLGSDTQLARVSAQAIIGTIPWIITTAKQGGAPDFGSGVEIAPVIGSRGRVTIWRTVEEVYGEDRDGRPLVVRTDRVTEVARGGTYSAGAFCKLKWERSPADVAADRAVYASWHAGLCWLADRLAGVGGAGSLASRRPKLPTAPMSPWIEAAPERRMLRVVEGTGQAHERDPLLQAGSPVIQRLAA